MLRIVLYAVGFALGAAALFLVSGFLMPRDHHAEVVSVIHAPQAKVWSLVFDMANTPTWQTGVAAVEHLPSEDGHAVWKQTDRSGNALIFVERRSAAPGLLVREARDPDGAFGGTWTIELEPIGEGTKISIREDGWVAFAPFRPIQRFFIGLDATMKSYLVDLERAATQGYGNGA